jgi:DNA-directed DNA polymerase III PolC
MRDAYVNLHVHTEFSLLDGHGLTTDLAKRAAALGHTHLAMTDHGTMAGAAKFHAACTKAGVVPIVGLEAYVAPSGRHVRDSKNREQLHLTLVAINAVGYRNLSILATHGGTDGFYYKPRIDHEVLAQHNEGIVCLSGCIAGELAQAILARDDARVTQTLDFYSSAFPGRYFLEFQNHGNLIPDQTIVNRELYQLAQKYGLPGVGTNDCHFCMRTDYEAQKLLTAINSGQKQGSSVIFSSPYNFLRSNEEMRLAFGDSPLLRNSLEIASWVEPYTLGDSAPKLPVSPAEIGGIAPSRALIRRCEEGLKRRLKGTIPPEYRARLDRELDVIAAMSQKLGVPFERYILSVMAITDFCRQKGIWFGPRGSAAGSIVCWAIGISELDPLRDGLLFERFLNEDRVELPDIDIDIADNRRDEVMRFILEQYGVDRVAKIGTYTAIGAKMAIRDGGRAISHSLRGNYLELTTKLSSLVPHDARVGGIPLDELLAAEGPFTREVDDNPEMAKIVEAAKMIAGRLRQESTNAAGVVICDRPIIELTPLNRVRDPEKAIVKVQTSFEKEYLEELGILKMDVLGLSTLAVLEETIRSIERASGQVLDPWAFPVDDKETWWTIHQGHTMALFQLGSKGMTRLIKEFRPADIGELALVIAFFRPGPMQSLEEIVRRKNGESPAIAPHPRLQGILQDTYGIPVFQEQVMEIMREVAGFSLSKADIVRKAMGKKKRELMATFEVEVRTNGLTRGFTEEDLAVIWDFILPFADYGFNKCAHSLTRVRLADGRRVTLARAFREQPTHLMAMWEDGTIRPHKVMRIVKTGRKPLLKVTLSNEWVIKATAEHRLLTTRGYRRIDEMQIGDELITVPYHDGYDVATKRATMTRLNKTDDFRQRSAERMVAYQAARSPEAKSAHMHLVHEQHPELREHLASVRPMAHEAFRRLWHDDPAWRETFLAKSLANVRADYDTGPGYGHCSIASNGMWCASTPERAMCEWLIEQGIDFSMHKPLPSGRMCDFYVHGIYWEMDGMDRVADYFATKYGDLPYVVVTPEDFRAIVAGHLTREHAINGTAIVAIEPCGEHDTYDVEMEDDGPKNFIANGIVSHNSHAYCYAYTAYQTAYLKTHEPQHFYSAALTVEARGGSKDRQTPQMRVGTLALEARRRGVQVLPPDVNHSQPNFVPEGATGVRFGLAAIKGVGMPDARLVAKHAPFSSIGDLVINTGIKRTALDNMVRVGAVPFGTRAALLDAIPDAQGLAKTKKIPAGQKALFDAVGRTTTVPLKPLPEIPGDEILAWEQERLGMFTSPLPLIESATCTLGELGDLVGEAVTTYGVIASMREITTKRGELMAFVAITDGTAQVDVVFFPQVWADKQRDLREGTLLVVTGQVEDRGEEFSLICRDCYIPDIDPGTSMAAPLVQELVEVRLCLSPVTVEPEEAIERLKLAVAVARNNPGPIAAEIGYGKALQTLSISRGGAQQLLQHGATPIYASLMS